jgi:hypothetical protein
VSEDQYYEFASLDGPISDEGLMGADDCQRVPGLKCLLLRKVGKATTQHNDGCAAPPRRTDILSHRWRSIAGPNTGLVKNEDGSLGKRQPRLTIGFHWP